MPLENIKQVENVDQNKDTLVDAKESQDLKEVLNKVKTPEDKKQFVEALKKNDQKILNLLSQNKDFVNSIWKKWININKSEWWDIITLKQTKEKKYYENSQTWYETKITSNTQTENLKNLSMKIEWKNSKEEFWNGIFDGSVLDPNYMDNVISTINWTKFTNELKNSAINSVQKIVALKKNAIADFNSELPKSNLWNLLPEINKVQQYLKNPVNSDYDVSNILKWQKENPNHENGQKTIKIALEKIKSIDDIKKISTKDYIKYSELTAFLPKFQLDLLSWKPQSIDVRFDTSTDTMTEYSRNKFEQRFSKNEQVLKDVFAEGKKIVLTWYSSDLWSEKKDDAIKSERLKQLSPEFKMKKNITESSGLAILRAEALKNQLIAKLWDNIKDNIIVDSKNSWIDKDPKKKGDLLAQRVEMKIN